MFPSCIANKYVNLYHSLKMNRTAIILVYKASTKIHSKSKKNISTRTRCDHSYWKYLFIFVAYDDMKLRLFTI